MIQIDKLLRFWVFHQEMLKAGTIKSFEYLSLGKELKAQASSAEKQYQVLDKIFEPDGKEEPITIKKTKQK